MSLELRAPREDDLPSLARLLDEHALAAFGEREDSEEQVRHWLTLPEIWVRVAERDGRMIGYADVSGRDGGTRFDLDARALDPEAAAALLGAAEEHARSEAASSALIRGVVHAADRALVDSFGAAGWRRVRTYYRMVIELGANPDEPSWPNGISVRTLRPGEEERVYEAHMEAFADHWDFHRQPFEHWRVFNVDRPGFDPELWWLAEDGSELASLALNSWHSSGDPQFGWVSLLGVRPAWRHRGLGLALLQHSFRDFAQRGATRVGLGVDADSTTGAVRLYERAGMRVARCNDVYEKPL
jgi:mycothiol synthase